MIIFLKLKKEFKPAKKASCYLYDQCPAQRSYVNKLILVLAMPKKKDFFSITHLSESVKVEGLGFLNDLMFLFATANLEDKDFVVHCSWG